MNYFKKSFKFLFICWLIELFIFVFFYLVDAYIQNNIISDGVANITKKEFLVGHYFMVLSGCIILIIYLISVFCEKKGRALKISHRYYLVFCLIGLIGVYYSILAPINIFEKGDLISWRTKKYSSKEVLTQIKMLPDYQGDTLVLYKNGVIHSTNNVIQSVIFQMYDVPYNLQGIKRDAVTHQKSEAYFAYKTAIFYYLQAHPKKK